MQNWPFLTYFWPFWRLKGNFLKNCSVTFFLIWANERPSCLLSTVETPFSLNRSKLVKMSENRLKRAYFALKACLIKNSSVVFLLIAAKEWSLSRPSVLKRPIWLNHSKLVKSGLFCTYPSNAFRLFNRAEQSFYAVSYLSGANCRIALNQSKTRHFFQIKMATRFSFTNVILLICLNFPIKASWNWFVHIHRRA